jgi:hypothetical protein
VFNISQHLFAPASSRPFCGIRFDMDRDKQVGIMKEPGVGGQ